jgi:Tol biopolymer transport system component
VARRRFSIVILAPLAALVLSSPGDAAPPASREASSLASRDGLIAFEIFKESTRHGESPRIDIYAVRPDGTQARSLISFRKGGGNAVGPDWSPDGTMIAFHGNAFANRDSKRGIFTANADGSERTLVFRTEPGQGIRQVAWSPDGTRIAFILEEYPADGGSEADFLDRLFVMDADGDDVTMLTNEDQQVVRSPGHRTAPAWSTRASSSPRPTGSPTTSTSSPRTEPSRDV